MICLGFIALVSLIVWVCVKLGHRLNVAETKYRIQVHQQAVNELREEGKL